MNPAVMDQPLPGLVEIEPPPAPPPLSVWPAAVAASLALLLLLYAFWQRRRRRPRAVARRRLRALLHRCHRRSADPRQCAHLLAAVLAPSVRPGAAAPPAPAGVDPAQWRAFLQTLNRLRFARQPPEPADVLAVARQALAWLDEPRV